MNFVVTDSLLGEVIYDSVTNFSMRTPKNLTKENLSSDEEKKLMDAGFKALYTSSKNGENFIVFDLNKLSDSIFKKYYTQLESNLKNNSQFKKVSIDSFYSSDFFIKQFFSLSDKTVNLKLLLNNFKKGHYEIDFSVPLVTYNNEGRTI